MSANWKIWNSFKAHARFTEIIYIHSSWLTSFFGFIFRLSRFGRALHILHVEKCRDASGSMHNKLILLPLEVINIIVTFVIREMRLLIRCNFLRRCLISIKTRTRRWSGNCWRSLISFDWIFSFFYRKIEKFWSSAREVRRRHKPSNYHVISIGFFLRLWKTFYEYDSYYCD